MSYDLMNADYVIQNIDGVKKPVIHLFARDIDRKLHDFTISNFTPYFYAPDDKGTVADLFGRCVSRINTVLPADVKERRRDLIWHDEADILFWLRFLIDRGIFCGFTIDADRTLRPTESLNIPIYINFFDIEVESPPEIMAKPLNPKWPIVSIQNSNNYDDEIEIYTLDTKCTGPVIPKPEWAMHAVRCYIGTVHFTFKDGRKITVQPKVYDYDDERLMLTDWCLRQQYKKFDGYSGYNSGGAASLGGYDWPYLIRRCSLLGVNTRPLSPFGKVSCYRKQDPETKKFRMDPYIKGLQLIDYMVAYMKWSGGRQGAKLVVPGKDFAQTFDFKLVMERECGFVYDDLGDKVLDSRRNHPQEWLTYITGDAFALALLEKMKKIIADFDTLRRLVGAPLEWAFHNSKMIDLRLLRVTDKPLPSKKYGIKEKVRGALVFLPKKGMKYAVGIFDIKALYPSLIRVYNLSPETLVDPADLRSHKVKMNEVTKVGPMEDGSVYYFRKEPEGLLPKAIRHEMENREILRAKLKGFNPNSPEYDRTKVLETKYKFLACSYYGATGYENFRLVNKTVRKCITFLGREANRDTRTECSRNGYETTYGDTDSVFIQFSGSSFREGLIVEDIINKTLTKIARKHGAFFNLESKYETFCKRILFIPILPKRRKVRPWLHQGEVLAAKKRYSYIDEKNDLYVVGLAPRRSSTPKIVRSTMLEWLRLIMIKQDTLGAIKLIRKLWEELPTYPLNMIGLPKGLHKDVYDSRNPWQIGAAFMTERYGKIFREDKKTLLIYLVGEKKKHNSDAKYRVKKSKIKTKMCMSFNNRKYEEGKQQQLKGWSLANVACITETDTALPADLQSRIAWNKMRKKVIQSNFEPMFAALDISWDKVILASEQTGLGGFM